MALDLDIIDRVTKPLARTDTDVCWYGLNENTSLLKIIAMVVMIIDHTAAIYLPYNYDLRMIGRLSFPLFCWCLVVGAQHTRNIGKYALRLLGLAVVSQPFFMLALRHSWNDFSIFVTLLFGLVGIAGIQHKHYELPILMLVLSFWVRMDYGTRGVACILAMYMLRKNPYIFTMGFVLFCAAWGLGPYYGSIPDWQYQALRFWGNQSMVVARVMGGQIRMQQLAVTALPLILIPMRKRWRVPGGERWLYWVYPVHLGILYIIRVIIK